MSEKRIQMTSDDWRELADEAIEHAVGWVRNSEGELNRAAALEHAAAMLRAADTFNGRANHLDMFEIGPDATTTEVFDDEPAGAS